MYKTLILSSLAICAVTSGALGANLGAVNCSDPQMVEIMEKNSKSARIDGSPAFSYGFHTGKILSSKTLLATKNKLVCGITIKITQGGSTQNLRLTYTFEQFANGKIKATLADR